MNASKKSVALFLIIAFVLIHCVVVSANASVEADNAPGEMPVLPRDVFVEAQMWLYVSNFAETMDVSDYELTVSEAELMLDGIASKASYILNTRLKYDLITNDKCVKTINFTYRKSSSYSAKSPAVQAEIERILGVVNDSMSDIDKALAVNDYFCTNYSYDTTYSIYTMEELFVEKTGVCQAYALAYYYILNNCLNIDCALVTCDPMNHMWNSVKIDDEWYHVDVTWNDPVPDFAGRACHSYFMKSSTSILDIEHDRYGWQYKGEKYWLDDIDIECLSTKYDNYFWADVNSPILFDEEHYYYVGYADGEDSSGKCCVVKIEKNSGKTYELFRINDYWGLWNSNYVYTDKFATIAPYGDLIAVNTTENVHILDHDGNICQKYDLTNDGSEESIYFIQIYGDTIHCTMSRDYPEFGTEHIITFKLSPIEAEELDINGDSEVSDDDTNFLAEYFTGWSRYFNIMSADLNGDGKLNRLDLLLFAQSIAD